MPLVPLVLVALAPQTVLIQGGTVIDGSGRAGFRADVRISSNVISEIGRLKPRAGEVVISARGLVVAPGFIDAHSHAEGEILTKRDASVAVLQGITTAVVGQDGGSQFPLADFIARFNSTPATINLASFVGHGTLRERVMGEGSKRKATAQEVERMTALAAEELKAGALGLSTGLEYDPGFYAATEEVVAVARAAARLKGMYISHVRDEENEVLESIREVAHISKAAPIPAQVSHIKLASKPVWGKAKSALQILDSSRLTADVYPYLFWQSSITVLIPSRDWEDREQWRKGLEEVGGPGNVRLARYTPNPSWEGRTLDRLAQDRKKDVVSLIQEIVRNTREGGSESVVVKAMTESDLIAFLKHPKVMFCTDGGLSPRHPRGAGSFPKILGEYVRVKKSISLHEAIRKMTSFPAQRFGLRGRGLIRKGYFADLVIFNPSTVKDEATLDRPSAPPTGILHVFTNGRLVVRKGALTQQRPGRFVKRG